MLSCRTQTIIVLLHHRVFIRPILSLVLLFAFSSSAHAETFNSGGNEIALLDNNTIQGTLSLPGDVV